VIKFALEKIFGTQNSRTLKQLWPIVRQVSALEPAMEKLSDAELRAKTDEFRERFAKGATLDDLLVEAYAVVREAARRTIQMRHFDVQILGGIVLHQGRISEMATGEGKTLVATLPLYLNALTGKGCHLITVNDYLARRDRNWMGPVYEFLGLTVGVIQHDIKALERQAAYRSDITYGTNNEFGFDYLRDNMVVNLDDRAQRGLHYAIVDEVDSILIDEARTPLIISGPAEESTDKYYRASRGVREMRGYRITREEVDPEWKAKLAELKKEYDYIADEKAKTISLTEGGEAKGAQFMGVENLHDMATIDERHQIITALRAKEFFQKDVDYIVKDGKVVIVDEFTGRLMPGRRWSDGLHQAVEAREGLVIERENQTLATITFQNYFRMYKKLGGMTGTAATEAVEFHKIYKLDVVVVPTNKSCVRDDGHDVIYRTEREKFSAVVEEIARCHKGGQPVLVGTISIEKSESLSQMLTRKGLPHTVLNAKYHEKEAEIVARAGQEAVITIATNMAGRGTDIVLGTGVAQKGGLHVLGTERHEARRIDNQLRGRSGRQGDPGSSKFFISLEDELMRIFGSDRISGLMQRLGMQEGEEIQHPLVSKAIETAQKRVETRNFEIRKHLLEFDDVMNRQREIIYSERDRVLKKENLQEHLFEMIEDVVESLLARYIHPDLREDEKKPEELAEALAQKFGVSFNGVIEEVGTQIESLTEKILERVKAQHEYREKMFGRERMEFLERFILLQVVDSKWKEHLYALDNLREGIHLRAYGQRDPLVEYKREAFLLFDEVVESVKNEAVELLFKVAAVREERLTSAFERTPQEFVHPEAERIPETNVGAVPGGRPFLGSTGHPQGGAPTPAAPQPRQPIHRDEPKVGRNDPCPCGSGKKYKKCHGA